MQLLWRGTEARIHLVPSVEISLSRVPRTRLLPSNEVRSAIQIGICYTSGDRVASTHTGTLGVTRSTVTNAARTLVPRTVAGHSGRASLLHSAREGLLLIS